MNHAGQAMQGETDSEDRSDGVLDKDLKEEVFQDAKQILDDRITDKEWFGSNWHSIMSKGITCHNL